MADDPATYRCLVAIPLVSGAFEAGELLTENENIPEGWEPVAGLVDPLNSRAVAAYHATCPMPPPAARQFEPVTFWVVAEQLPTCTLWRLTGLGADLDPVGI
jgi:hypothetical protein